MSGGYPCCCGADPYEYRYFQDYYNHPPYECGTCAACLNGCIPNPIVVEISGISAGPNCSSVDRGNGTYVIPFTLTTLTTCVHTMTLPPPSTPGCGASSILVESITSGPNMTINVILYFGVREIRWNKYYPGVTTFFDCVNMDESMPFLAKSPGLDNLVVFDNSPCRLVSPAVL